MPDPRFSPWFLVLMLATSLLGQSQIQLSSSFTAADGARTWVDIGGTWNGTTEVTSTAGDTFTLTIQNTASGAPATDTAHDLGLTVTLPTGFTYVSGTIAGVAGIAAGQSGTTLTVTIPGSTTIAPGAQIAISFGLTTATTVVASNLQLDYTFGYANSSGGSQLQEMESQSIQAFAGGSTILKTPNDQTKAVNETAQWTITVTNTGLGGLFDVEIDEGALAGHPSLLLTAMVQTAPALSSTGSAPLLTLPYLGPGESFIVDVDATVIGCENINNTVATDDRTGATSKSASAQVTFDLTTPLIGFTPPSVALNYGAVASVSFAVQNTGAGDAKDLVLNADYAGLGLNVTNLSSDWSHSAGVFTYTANGGVLSNGASSTLSFDIQDPNECDGSISGAVVWSSDYKNVCDQQYNTPTSLASVVAATDAPGVTLSATGPQRLEVSEASSWGLTLSASNLQHISTDPIVVTATIPAGVTGVSIPSPPAGTVANCGTCTAGGTITWSVPQSELGSSKLLTVNFTAPSDPCLGGGLLTLNSGTSATTTASCIENANSAATTLLINNPGGTVQQTFNVAAAPDGTFETGSADDGDGVYQLGEGEFIPFIADFDFAAGTAGTWAGSTYTDDYGSLATQDLVVNSLVVTVDGGSAVAVPSGSVTASPGSLVIDLGFMAGASYANDANVANHSFSFAYLTTISDSDLGGSSSRTYIQRATLSLAGGASGCTTSGSVFTLGTYVTIARAAATLNVSVPSQITLCESFSATFTIGNGTPEFPSNVLLTLDTSGDYEFITGQTPTYGGFLSSANVTFTENGGVNPTFEVTPAATEVTANGTVTVMMRRKATSSTTPTALQATVTYDDNETTGAGARAFSTPGSATPVLIREADLLLSATPQSIQVVGPTAQWVLYVTNGGDGASNDTALELTLPAGLTPNATLTDAANPGFAVTVSSQQMSWDLASVAAGATQAITVVADIAGTTCSIPINSVPTSVTWGCGSVTHQTTAATEPNFTFPPGELQVVHVVTSKASLCNNAQVEFLVRNVGLPYVYGLTLSENLAPSTTGLTIVPGSVEFKRNTDVGWTSTSDPTGTGAPYQWTTTEIAALSELAPTSVSGGVHEIRIRFNVAASELSNAATQSITASAAGTLSCGNSVSAPGSPFSLPIDRPTINVAVTGRNTTAGQVAYTETVYGADSDSIEWRIVITNAGNETAANVRLTHTLPGTGVTAFTLNGPGHTNTILVSGTTIQIDDVTTAGATYTATALLGSTCVNGNDVAAVTWGCVSNGPTTPSNLSSPGNSTDSAALVMIPSFSGAGTSQSFTPLQSGLVQVDLTFTNQGGQADNLVFTDTLPAGLTRYTSFTPTYTTTGSVTNMVVGGSGTAPTFTMTGSLRNGENVVVTFVAIQTGSFDTTTGPFANPETVANGFDPSLPAGGTNTAAASFDSSCGGSGGGSENATLDPATPDLDIAVSPPTQVVADGASYSFDFTLTNSGDAGSIAGDIDFRATMGAGWTTTQVEIITAGGGGTTGVCTGLSCTAAEIGTLAAGSSAVIRVSGTANDNGSALTVVGEVEGSLTGTSDNYSLDQAQVAIVGFSTDLTLQSTSETFTTTATDVAIGEEATWRLSARLFGGTTLRNVTMRDVLPAGLGYVSHSATGNNSVTISSVTGNTQVQAGTIDFNIADVVSGVGTFEVDLVTRALNVVGNTEALALTNNFGASVQLDYGSGNTQTFASNGAAEGFGGAESALHEDSSVTVRLPDLSFDKQVRNVTATSAFGDTGTGQSGDVMEYRITVQNSGTVPAFDLAIPDTLGTAKLVMVDGASDGVDNDGDGLIDGADSGGEGTFVATAGGSATFNHGNTGLTAGSSLAQLDAGNSITLLYRATLANSVNPTEVLANNASMAGSSLAGPSGNQTAPTGTSGSASGERTFTDSDVANTTVEMIAMTKTILTTSVGSDQSATVLIGEQVRFELSLALPSGTVPSFEVQDLIPAGLELLATPAVTVGSQISGGQPTITPGTLPASGPVTVRWDFGTRTVGTGGVAADRQVTITYVTQVRNIAANDDGTEIDNLASYSYTGSAANSTTVRLTIDEAAITIPTFSVSPTGVVDAGQILTYSVTLDNGGSQSGFDLAIDSLLPAGVTYVANSTTPVSGPTIGEPDVSGSNVVWGRAQAAPQDIDLAAGQSVTFTFQGLVGDGVEPDQALQTGLAIDWTSLDGDPGPNLGTAVGSAAGSSGERTGSGVAPNDLAATTSVTSTVSNVYSVTSTASGDTVSGDGFRIGDLVTYTVVATLQEGTVDAFRIRDTLPAGMAFFDAQAITPASGSNGFTYTAPTAPTAGATGLLTWDFGTVVNAGDNNPANDTLTLVYRARVLDTGGITSTPTTQVLTNSTVLSYQDEMANPEVAGPVNDPVNIRQPDLSVSQALASGQPGTVGSDDTVDYTLTVTNDGDAPAYNTQVQAVLPVGMRGTSPVNVTATLNGSPVTLSAPVYSSATGVTTWSLADGQQIDPSSSLVLTYRTTVDTGVGGGVTLGNSASVQNYHSLPSSSPTERRQYGAVLGNNVNVVTPAPTAMTKAADKSTANIGETVTFTLTVPAAGVDVTLYDVNVLDDIDARYRVTSIVDNSAGLGTTTSAGSSGNEVDLVFAQVPPNTQAVVTVTAVVENQVGTVAGNVIPNQAAFTWAQSPAGATQSAINSATVNVTVTEPTLGIAKVVKSQNLSNPAQGLQANDTVTYTITVTNSGTGPAHGFVLRDLADEDLISPVVAANPDNPGAPASSSTSGGVTTYVWNAVAGPLAAAGGVYAFDVTLTVGSGVMPFQNMSNDAEVDWYSAASGNPDRRGPGDGYTAATPSPATVTSGTASTDLLNPSGDTTYAIGEEVTFRMTFDYVQGQVTALHLRETLPSGVEFVSAVVGSTNTQRTGGGPVTILAEPAAGATGLLDFTIGDVESTAANPTVYVDVTVRVQDVVGNIDGAVLTTTSDATLESPPGNTQTINAQTNEQITVVEPDLVLALDGPTEVALGTPANLTVRASNNGTSSAWQPRIELELPSDLRFTDPTTLPLTAVISGGRSLVLAAGSDFSTAWNSSTGRLVLTLSSAQAYIGVGETLTWQSQAELAPDATDNGTLAMTATVTDYASVDGSAGTPPIVRTTTTTFGVGTTGTGNGAAGDDATDDHSALARLPVLTVTKAVDNVVTDPGLPLHYTVTIQNTGSLDATGATLSDHLDPYIAAGSLTNVTLTPATGTINADPNGGNNSTGLVTVTALTVASGTSVVLQFDCTVAAVVPNQSKVANQASLTVSGFPNPFVSDSTSSSDDNGIEEGNDASDPNDDDPTTTTIGSLPVLDVGKTATDLNGAPLEPGDVIRYSITVDNVGNENASQTLLTDAIPASTSYVEGSALLNGSPLADVGGTSPFVSGHLVNSPGEAGGRLVVGVPATVSFDVVVDPSAGSQTVVSNQAMVDAQGEGTATPVAEPSDDPATSTDDDPTRMVLGSNAAVDATKIVVDENGGFLQPSEFLTYSISVENFGASPATGVVFRDPIPANTTFVPGSATLDPDGAGPIAGVALTDALDGDAGDFGVTAAGTLTVNIGTLPESSNAVVTFRVQVDSGLTSGTEIANQGFVASDGQPEEPTDADGNDGNGDQATVAVVGDVAAVEVTKSATDLNGGMLAAGDTLRFVLTLRNVGTQDATNVVLTDAVPPTPTTYVAGSTRVGGSVIADDAGPTSPLVAGYNLGTLAAGATRTVTVDVLVPTSAALGTNIVNQASLAADGGINETSNSIELAVGGSPATGAISGFVWQDDDHDRVLDSGEPMQGGWLVRLVLNGQVVATATTESDGSYSLTGIPPGAGYEIRFEHPTNGATYGGAISSAPGVTTSAGTIQNLTVPAGSITLDQSLPIDPSGIFYNSITREPIDGVVLEVLGPAGFDPTIHLLPGQHLQTTDATGFYRFDLVPGAPPGVYTIAPRPPTGFLPSFPSAVIPPQSGPLDPTGQPDPFLIAPQNTAPQIGEPTDYYIAFDLAPGDPNVVNNHVAIDPVLDGAIAITKTTSKTDVVRGDLVPYRITVTNTLAAALPAVGLTDTVPPGFKFVPGSARLDGVLVDPVQNGRELTWPSVILTANQTRELTLILVVGSGVPYGRFDNLVHAVEQSSGSVISNVARAAVRVVPDPLFDGSDVIGQVFADHDGDGYQDDGEPGLPGIRLVTARGLIVETDAHGRYHLTQPLIVARSRGSNLVIKLDERSLPAGWRMTSENPRVVRLTRGKIVKANFGVVQPRELRIEFSDRAFGKDGRLDPQWHDYLERLARSRASGERADGDEGRDAAAESADSAGAPDRDRAEQSAVTVLRLAYMETAGSQLGRQRLDAMANLLTGLWESHGGVPVIERETVVVRALPPARPLAEPRVGSGAVRPAKDSDAGAGVRLQADLDGGELARELTAIARSVIADRPELRFRVRCNYASLVHRAEVRVFVSPDAAGPPVVVLPLDVAWRAAWVPRRVAGHVFGYSVRVYDTAGRFDETRRQRVTWLGDALPFGAVAESSRSAAELVPGGVGAGARAVRVLGQDLSPGQEVRVEGMPCRVQPDGSFETRVLVPPGAAGARVTIVDPNGAEDLFVARPRARQPDRPGYSSAARPVPKKRGDFALPALRVRAGDNSTPVAQPTEVDTAMLPHGLATPDRSPGQPLDVDVQFDAGRLQKLLNVTAWPNAAYREKPVSFQAYSNYADWIAGAEVRIFPAGAATTGEPLAVLPLDARGRARWTPLRGHGAAVQFVLRVTGHDGAWDETAAKDLRIADTVQPVDDAHDLERELLAGYGRSHLLRDRIVVRGGTVTVSGRDLEPDSRVVAMGRDAPVDPTGRFVASQILPPGERTIAVAVEQDGRVLELRRKINMPDEDWFYVGIADLTASFHDTSGAATLAEGGDRDDVYVDGRVALFVKGRIKGDLLLTAMVDTEEGDIDSLLKNLDARDPRQLLRRLDPDRHYLVYGDDSTTTQGAPTAGRMYVRLDRGNDHVMWGSFEARVLDTELAQIDRALYGAHLLWQSDDETSRGQARSLVEGFAAEPETVSAREEFRGTGGSLFYLRQQDLTIGSERVRIEVRDRDSGLVLSVQNLAPFEDYDLNYIQGRILLTKPVPSVADPGFITQNQTLNGHPVYLVVRYEYAPVLDTLDNLALGGRASTWLGDHVRFGVTGSREEELGADRTLLGADVRLQRSPTTWLKLEGSRTTGPARSDMFSIDGGFSFGGVPSTTLPGDDAWAWRAEGSADLSEVLGESWRGQATAWYQHRDRGFSAPGQLTTSDTDAWGANLDVGITDNTTLLAKYDQNQMDFGAMRRVFHADLRRKLNENWSATIGGRHDDFSNDLGSPFAFEIGRRTDLAARLDYDSLEDWSAYLFGQTTVDRADSRQAMNRVGVGGKIRVNDALELNGELSVGNAGFGANVGSDWRVTDRTNLYLSYALGTDTTEYGLGHRTGTVTGGVKHRFSDAVSVYGEERYQHGDRATGLTHAYGVDITPTDEWTLGVSLEDGELRDPLGGVLERTSATVSAGYDHEDLKVGSAVEYREDSAGGSERQTWLTRANTTLRLAPEWRAITKFNLSHSNGSGGQYFDGDFVEASLGAAYRPVDSDWLNWLFVYTYLADLPSPGQVVRTGGVREFEQRSHVLSVDGWYDLSENFTLGGKYAIRFGQLRDNRVEAGDWFESRTQLGVLRLDWHVVKNWDAHLEGRWHGVDVARDEQLGALLGIYRHMNDHVRLGAGWNFTDFSDRVTDLSYDSQGFFVNLMAKF